EGPGAPAQGPRHEEISSGIVVQVQHEGVGNVPAHIIDECLPTLLWFGRVAQLKCAKTASDQYRVPGAITPAGHLDRGECTESRGQVCSKLRPGCPLVKRAPDPVRGIDDKHLPAI